MLPAIQNELKTLLLSLHFLTRIPTPFEIDYTPERLSSASRYYPIVGAIIGSVAALAFFLASLALPTIVAVLIATAATALITGAFHEDGLADTFDGISGAYDRARSLEIMTDSRIGTFGALALIIVISTKVAALSSLADTTTIITALIAAHILSRTSTVIVMATSRYAKPEGIAGPQDQTLSPINTIIATFTALVAIAVIALVLTPTTALLATAGAITGHILIRLYFQPKLKGHTGDTLGATQQITELAIYIALATL
ncbi:MAG: adenosylcobinamide-GDP ribazoletransferase [Chloroflexi bacterium]|nr:adenosylcobinamide-GDP ribazoletransferase [Chloroflexota bacterium]